jgi:cephalosporin hydroxylase
MYNIPKKSNATQGDYEHFNLMNERKSRRKPENLACEHELTKIAHKYRETTDKGPTATYWRKHCYTEFYGPLLEHIRKKPLNILEIGVRWGGSILMWDDFFEDCTLYGVDINMSNIDEKTMKEIEKRDNIELIKSNAYSSEFARKNFGDVKFDFILDDGSHQAEHQVSFFNIYKDYVKKGGYLMCEDFPTIAQAKYVMDNFDGKINNMTLIDRTHCIPSGKGEIIIMYKE